MPDNVPTPPGGATPPKPAEASKVQPKKETVRINLPPKPTSAPTIKLPTLAPGTPPPHASGTATAAPMAVAAAVVVPAAKAPPASAAPARAAAVAAAPASSIKPAPAPAAPRPMAAPMVVGLTALDKGLAIAAAVVSVGALACVAYLAFMLKDTATY